MIELILTRAWENFNSISKIFLQIFYNFFTTLSLIVASFNFMDVVVLVQNIAQFTCREFFVGRNGADAKNFVTFSFYMKFVESVYSEQFRNFVGVLAQRIFKHDFQTDTR